MQKSVFVEGKRLISDDEVRQRFAEMTSLPDVLSGFRRAYARQGNNAYTSDPRIHMHVFRGKASRFWVDAPEHGCKRCMALFNDYDVVPKYCFDCYKVLIVTRTVLELFKLLYLFEKLELPDNNSRKCMVDNRGLSSGTYKGFVYCRGLDEARQLREIVEQAVFDDISEGIPVTVKRGCTEYSVKYPEFAQFEEHDFQYQENWTFYEEFVDKHWIFPANCSDTFDEDGKGTEPMRELLAFQWWLQYAATVGDNSYLIVNGGKPLQPIKDT